MQICLLQLSCFRIDKDGRAFPAYCIQLYQIPNSREFRHAFTEIEAPVESVGRNCLALVFLPEGAALHHRDFDVRENNRVRGSHRFEIGWPRFRTQAIQ